MKVRLLMMSILALLMNLTVGAEQTKVHCLSGTDKGHAQISGRQPLHFYGRVNHWADSRDELTKELDLMQQVGVDGYMIELSGWGQEKWSKRWLRQTARAYRWLHRQCRKRNILLFVSIVNDNMGLHKYGDKGPSLEVVENEARKLVGVISKGGSQGVYVQPVAETQTAAGRRMEQYCIERLKDFMLVYNGHSGFPETVCPGFRYRAVHPAHISPRVPEDAFIISDHGQIIRELTADGSLDAPADSLKLARWVSSLHERGVRAIGYYAFQYRMTDTTAIRILGHHPDTAAH